MQPHTRRMFMWLYLGVLVAATAAGIWLGYPYVQQQRLARASTLKVDVYAHPFVSFLKDTPISAHGSASLDTFFSQDFVNQTTAEILARHPAPLAKGADRETWMQEFSADLMASLNDYMGRRYRDAWERLEVSNDLKGQVLVRLANVGSAPVEGIRVEVAGGKLFMQGPPDVKLRSLGTRAMQIPTIAPGEKLDLFALTTEEVVAGAATPLVKVSSRNRPFPIVVHAPETGEAKLKFAGWVTFGTLYAVIILGGLLVGISSLIGLRASPRKPAKTAPAPASIAASSVPASRPASSPVADVAWRRPNAV